MQTGSTPASRRARPRSGRSATAATTGRTPSTATSSSSSSWRSTADPTTTATSRTGRGGGGPRPGPRPRARAQPVNRFMGGPRRDVATLLPGDEIKMFFRSPISWAIRHALPQRGARGPLDDDPLGHAGARPRLRRLASRLRGLRPEAAPPHLEPRPGASTFQEDQQERGRVMMDRRQVLGAGGRPEPPCGLPADYFPNVAVLTHTGRRALFYEDLIRDRTVLVHFFSLPASRIPVPENLAKVQALLGDRMGRDVFFYSLADRSRARLAEAAERARRRPRLALPHRRAGRRGDAAQPLFVHDPGHPWRMPTRGARRGLLARSAALRQRGGRSLGRGACPRRSALDRRAALLDAAGARSQARPGGADPCRGWPPCPVWASWRRPPRRRHPSSTRIRSLHFRLHLHVQRQCLSLSTGRASSRPASPSSIRRAPTSCRRSTPTSSMPRATRSRTPCRRRPRPVQPPGRPAGGQRDQSGLPHDRSPRHLRPDVRRSRDRG